MASAWQWASAPAGPPRSPPLPGLTLLTKNDMSACCACAAVVRSSVADAIAIKDSDAILNILNVLPFRHGHVSKHAFDHECDHRLHDCSQTAMSTGTPAEYSLFHVGLVAQSGVPMRRSKLVANGAKRT